MNHNSFKDDIKKISDTFIDALHEKYPSYRIQDLRFIANLLRELQFEYILRGRKYTKGSSFKEAFMILEQETEDFRENFISAIEQFKE